MADVRVLTARSNGIAYVPAAHVRVLQGASSGQPVAAAAARVRVLGAGVLAAPVGARVRVLFGGSGGFPVGTGLGYPNTIGRVLLGGVAVKSSLHLRAGGAFIPPWPTA